MSTSESEDFETYLRDVMHSRDTGPAGFTAGQVLTGGRRRRRHRAAAASGAALVAVVGLAVVAPAVLGAGRGGIDVGPAVSPATTSRSGTLSSLPARAPRVMSSPGTFDMGSGFSLELTGDSAKLAGPDGSVGPDYADRRHDGPATTTLMVAGRGIASLYSGAAQVARAVVTVDGSPYPAALLRLAGHPDWSLAYLVLPVQPLSISSISITVFDAAGHPLASDPPTPGPG
jgi:hypothetical protein